MTELEKARKRQQNNDHTVNTAIFPLLAEMAGKNIIPDGRFSDYECILWEYMCQAISLAKANAQKEAQL